MNCHIPKLLELKHPLPSFAMQPVHLLTPCTDRLFRDLAVVVVERNDGFGAHGVRPEDLAKYSHFLKMLAQDMADDSHGEDVAVGESKSNVGK